jgi:hypothetical protein
MEQLNPLEKDVAKRIFRIDTKKYKVITQDGEFIVDGDSCSCGYERDFIPSRSGGFEQSYDKRRQESCVHQESVLNSKNIGSCSECRNREVRKKKMNYHERHVMNRYICTRCENTIATV